MMLGSTKPSFHRSQIKIMKPQHGRNPVDAEPHERSSVGQSDLYLRRARTLAPLHARWAKPTSHNAVMNVVSYSYSYSYSYSLLPESKSRSRSKSKSKSRSRSRILNPA